MSENEGKTVVEVARAARAKVDARCALPRLGVSMHREMDRDVLALQEARAAFDALIAEHETWADQVRLLRADEAELHRIRNAAPPTDDEREALDRLSQWVAMVTNPLPGLRDHHEDCRVVVAMLRRQGPITDAQLLAALNAYDPRFATDNLDDYAEEHQADMRAALEAARDAS
ncbi:hypothetical protein ACEYYH_10585 [Microbacterium trichothecenolyticum]|uniref:hypothetical protein n=1 Tax=Microbacterium trichothecenolyticum TaxID=69370 RepID=UPI0035BE3F68